MRKLNLKRLLIVIGIPVCSIGSLILIGWLLTLIPLPDWLGGWPSMVPLWLSYIFNTIMLASFLCLIVALLNLFWVLGEVVIDITKWTFTKKDGLK
jgi:hypothetical protein